MKFNDIFEAGYHIHPIVNALHEYLKHFQNNKRTKVKGTDFNNKHLNSALQALRNELGLEIDHIDDDLHGMSLIEWRWEKNNLNILLKVLPPTVKEYEDGTEKVVFIVSRKDL